jgi:hypothetical protein
MNFCIDLAHITLSIDGLVAIKSALEADMISSACIFFYFNPTK